MIIYIVYFLINLQDSFQQTIPVSPFGLAKDICQQADGVQYSVNGFTGTPYVLKPFTNTFINPIRAQSSGKVCRKDGHCLFGFDIDIKEVQLRAFDSSVPACKKFPGTWFLSYNGSIPGPTISMPAGHESLVRFNNKINVKTGFFKETYSPCLPNNKRQGRPISVHLHGSVSLAPYDGWAEDTTCSFETKDYLYPNNRPNTGWYHDHALHVTADNAYMGLAAFYYVTSKKSAGGCGEPWNLESIEERLMILSDKVLDNKCQLFIDVFGVHKNNLYGDINLVSGIPFPLMSMEPKWYRFRIVNAAVSRPYLLKIKNSKLQDISQTICKIIASDGGYRNAPIAFPTSGLLIGVAERYEVVCDFSKLSGQSLYIWNDRDTVMMKDVPYFCYSHLVANLQILNKTSQLSPVIFRESDTSIKPQMALDKVLNQNDINTAIQMANKGQSHRVFKFGRSNGHWTINGESWASMKIAASDVGLNTWELWRFETGGGWFHPIHIHLIDFYMISRNGKTGLTTYEKMSPKDVFYLGPGNTVYTIARFGPHKGDYMFHCHNLIHEDDDMLRAFQVKSPQTGPNQQSANPFILNPLVGIVYNNWKYADPVLGETNSKPTFTVSQFNMNYFNVMLSKNLYRIFYPTPNDIILMKNMSNPWQVNFCKL